MVGSFSQFVGIQKKLSGHYLRYHNVETHLIWHTKCKWMFVLHWAWTNHYKKSNYLKKFHNYTLRYSLFSSQLCICLHPPESSSKFKYRCGLRTGMKRTPQVRSGLNINPTLPIPLKACIRDNKSNTKTPIKHIVCSKCGELARVYYMWVSLYSRGCGR